MLKKIRGRDVALFKEGLTQAIIELLQYLLVQEKLETDKEVVIKNYSEGC